MSSAPAIVAISLGYAGDFRAEAVRASAAVLRDVAGDVDAVECSTCTRVGEADAAEARKVRRSMAGGALGGIGCIFLAVGVFAAPFLMQQYDLIGIALIAALVLAFLGLGIVLGDIFRRPRQMRRVLATRATDSQREDKRLCCVGIEDAQT